MKYSVLAVVCFLAIISPSRADDIKDSLNAVDPATANMPITKVSSDQGLWKSQSEKSALTDVTSVYWALEAENTVADSIGVQHAPQFFVMCVENETRAIFKVHEYMGSDDIQMAYRVDRGPVSRINVSVSTDGSIFGFWNGTGVKFLRSLKDKKKLVISAKPWGQGPSEGVFNRHMGEKLGGRCQLWICRRVCA